MITSGILNLIYGFLLVVTSPLRLLPDVSLPSAALNSISEAADHLAILDQVFPIYNLLAVIGAVLVVEGAIFTYKIIKWVYIKIPGVN